MKEDITRKTIFSLLSIGRPTGIGDTPTGLFIFEWKLIVLEWGE